MNECLPLKRKVDKYFEENKPHAGLGRESLHSGVAFVAARGLNMFVQVGIDDPAGSSPQPSRLRSCRHGVRARGFCPDAYRFGHHRCDRSKKAHHPCRYQRAVLVESCDCRHIDTAPCRRQRIHRVFLRRACPDRHCARIIAYVCRGGSIVATLRTDAKSDAISAHGDNRDLFERGQQHRCHCHGVYRMGLLGACGKADPDVGLVCGRSMDELPMAAGAAPVYAGSEGDGRLRHGRDRLHHDGLSGAIGRPNRARLLLWGRPARIFPECASAL